MSWFLRFLGWATALVPPCWLLFDGYQRTLAAAVSRVLEVAGRPVDLARVNVGAPFDLGLFAALCLASRRAPPAARGRALALGVPALMAIEVALTSLAIGLMAGRRAAGVQGMDAAMRAGFYLTDTIPWVSGALLWMLLLGGWELPARPTQPPRA